MYILLLLHIFNARPLLMMEYFYVVLLVLLPKKGILKGIINKTYFYTKSTDCYTFICINGLIL